ncbi:MAG TPA: hypothetical protein PKA05_04395 [Roseiflexaceae bacterium]|nr:hypothetical protein [Roseiflexaceae bacterium]HMP39599.1 hypothetical protein [Roseiflexaceae bacterium]
MPRVNINIRDYDEAEELDELDMWEEQGGRGQGGRNDREAGDSPSRERANARRQEGKRWGREIARFHRQRERVKP